MLLKKTIEIKSCKKFCKNKKFKLDTTSVQSFSCISFQQVVGKGKNLPPHFRPLSVDKTLCPR